MINKVENILKLIQPNDIVLDVGGGIYPFLRADAVIDILPFESYLANKEDSTEKRSPVLSRWDGKAHFRQYFKVRSQKYGCLLRQSGALAQSLKAILSIFSGLKEVTTKINFKKETWYTGDICSPEIWAHIQDKAFDFVICSHTLEDIRDPIFVCSQLLRVAKAGYIEVPSKFRECAKTSADSTITGWEHHRWIVEVENGTISFKNKNPWIHHFDYLGDFRRSHIYDYFKQFTGILWRGSFDYTEKTQKGHIIETEDLFYFYDHYDYDRVGSFDYPPTFNIIDNVPFREKTIYLGHEYKLPVENARSIEKITEIHRKRLRNEHY